MIEVVDHSSDVVFPRHSKYMLITIKMTLLSLCCYAEKLKVSGLFINHLINCPKRPLLNVIRAKLEAPLAGVRHV